MMLHFPLHLYNLYLFLVAMDTIMNNAVGKYMMLHLPLHLYNAYLFLVAMDTITDNIPFP